MGGSPNLVAEFRDHSLGLRAKNLFGLRCCKAWPGFSENTLGELVGCYMRMFFFGRVVIGFWFLILAAIRMANLPQMQEFMSSERVKRI